MEVLQDHILQVWRIGHGSLCPGRADMPELIPPKQAVILAGGRGARLRPLTDRVPKPMIEFRGRPFLSYLLDLLKGQGIERVVLLLGYKADAVRGHYGDGSREGIEIGYSVLGEEAETGLRLKKSLSLLDEVFLLLYCDNYWPLDLGLLWEDYLRRPTPMMFTVYTNRDGYTLDNVRIGENGMVEVYDKSRKAAGLKGVEMGYAIVKRSVVEDFPEGNLSFEATVYPDLAGRGMLRAHPTDHRYYSISTPERLPMTEKFFSNTKVAILDRDGVINRKPPRAQYVTRWEDFHWLPGSKEAIRALKENGYLVFIVTNQAGIARGFMAEDDLRLIHERMQEELYGECRVAVDGIYYCPHGWDEGCECRKPKPGMLFKAQREHHFDLTKAWFVGDDERDALTGKAAGARTFLVSFECDLLGFVRKTLLS